MQATPLIRSSGDLLADRRYRWAEAALADGDGAAAVDLLAQAIELVPAYAPAWFLLGRARHVLGDEDGACAAFREAQRREPDDMLGAGLELARLGAADPICPMSPAYVRALFDGYAEGFDAHLISELHYRGPALICEALYRAQGDARFSCALDLGCGTGLMGEAIRARADFLGGCDLSARMVAKAREKGIYDRLAIADILTCLDGQSVASADLVLAADVLVYVGDATPLCGGVARVLAPGGLFAFTVQAHEGHDFGLGDDLRYAHSERHMRDAAGRAGLVPVLLEAAATRLERGKSVPGLVIVLRRA